MDSNHVTQKDDVEEDNKNAGQCKVLPAGRRMFFPPERQLERTSQEMFERLTHCAHLSTRVTYIVSIQYLRASNRIYRTKCKTPSVKPAQHFKKQEQHVSKFKTVCEVSN